MGLIFQFTNFRSQYALHGSYAPSGPDPVQFTAPNLIDRTAGGSWVTDGFAVGQRVQPVGTASNDQFFTIASLGVGDIITTVESTVTTEGPLTSGVTFDGVFIDPGGLEQWPAANVNAAGGPGPLTGLPTPWTPLVIPNALSMTGFTQDAVPFVDEFDWYISQRTEDPTKQLLTFTPRPASGGNTFSGAMGIEVSALGLTEYGISIGTPLTPFQTAQIFRNVHVYVKRLSDNLISFTDLLVHSTTVEFP